MEKDNVVDYDAAEQILDEIINSLKKIETINLKQKFMKEIQSDVLETDNLELFYKICTELNYPFNIELIQPYIEAVLNSKSAEYNYKFANRVIGVDISKHAKVVIESKDPEYNYLFAKNIKEADKKAHAKAVIRSKDPEYNYSFAKYIDEADKKAHAKAVVKSKDPAYNYIFIELLDDDINKAPHINVIIQSKDLDFNYLLLKQATTKTMFFKHSKVILNSKNPQYNYKVACYIKQKLSEDFVDDMWEGKSNRLLMQKIKNAHLKVLCQNNEFYYVSKFIGDMNDSQLQKYSNNLLESKNLEYNYNFASRKGINVLKHGQLILDSHDLKYNYLFAKNVKGADVLAHGKVIIESKDLEYNYKFAKDVEGADIDAHRLVILEAEKRNHVEEMEKIIIDRFLEEFPATDYSDEIMNVKSFIKKYNNN